VPELPGGDEIEELRTLTSRTYAREDGYYTVIALTPIHYFDARNRLRPIDLRLRPAKDGRATRAGVRTVIGRSPASVQVSARGSAARLRLAGTNVRATVTGRSATYRGALRATTLRYTPASRGVRIGVLLTSRRAPSQFVFPVELSGGLLPRVQRGRVDVVDITGARYFSLQPATVSEGEGLPTAARRSAVKLSILRPRQRLGFRVAVDRAWLKHPDRRYPVTIEFGLIGASAAPPRPAAPAVTVSPDPTAGREQAGPLPPLACLISSNVAKGPGLCPPPRLAVGRWTDGRRDVVARTLLRFDVSGISEIAEIDSAKLVLGLADHEPPHGQPSVSIHVLNRAFTQSATWRSYDAAKTWSSLGGDFSSLPAAEGGTFAGDALSFDVTPLVRGWVSKAAPNRGLLVKTADEEAPSRWSFCGPDADLTRCSPQLHVVHRDEEPPQEDSAESDFFLDREPEEPPDPGPTDCDNPDAPNEGPAPPELCGGPPLTTNMQITVWPTGHHGPAMRWTLRCFPTGGTLPGRSSACRKLLWLERPFPAVPAGVICLRADSASALARVRGRVRGRRVWATLRRTDRCQIARWQRVSFLLRRR
jgi:hypothetical protein